MGDAVGEHIGLAGAGAGDDKQRRRATRLAGAMLDGATLGVVQFAQRGGKRGGGANHGWDHAPQQSCFALCSQVWECGRPRPLFTLVYFGKVYFRKRRPGQSRSQNYRGASTMTI